MKRIMIISALGMALGLWAGAGSVFGAEAALPMPAAPAATLADPRDIYHQAVEARDNNDLPKAQALLGEILKDYPDFKDRDTIVQDLKSVNLQLIVSSLRSPVVTYQVAEGDSLGKIAKKYGTTIALIKLENQLRNNIIRVGQKLTVWTGNFNILINKVTNTLTVKSDDQVVKIYPVSTGKGDSSPEGEFTITTKMENPVWFHKGEIVPPGEENSLGTRWLGFNLPQYGIHGTLEPQLIGQSVSHGCVRMRNEDVEELFEYIPEGTKVQIIKQPEVELSKEKK
jgi:lipoprotein-anchoring transpeptidase ErfK/SrfK